MRGNSFLRTTRLISHLIRNPRNIARYFSYGLLNKKSPVDLALPWISFAAIDFLDSFITTEMNVFEYGVGGSTIFLAKRAKKVLCTEHSKEWIINVQKHLIDRKLNNVTIQYRPFDFNDSSAFADSSYLRSLPNEKFDVILIDGLDIEQKTRLECFYYAENFIQEKGIIIVDDAWRYPSLRKNNRSKNWKECKSVGPARYGVTTTEIFFY